MIKILGIAFLLAWPVLAHGNGKLGEFTPPDAGIPATKLKKLGMQADTELLERFVNPQNERFRLGLLHRLCLYGDIHHPSPAVMTTMKKFIEDELKACSGEVPQSRIAILNEALKVIGQRGGTPGIEYLKQWVLDVSVSQRLKCYASGAPPKNTPAWVRNSATIGLGRSGDQAARDFLASILKKTPNAKDQVRFRASLQSAITLNDQIRKAGIEKYVQHERAIVEKHDN